MPPEQILYTQREHVATITLNRPEKRNPLGMQTYAEIVDALQQANADESVRCIILTGAGSAFSSGGELGGDPHETSYDWHQIHGRLNRYTRAVRESDKPVIAAINGLCYGSGVILAAHCDLVVASSAARFSFIESRMGLAGIGMIAYHVGAQWAKFLMLSGEIISAERARRIGLVLEVLPEDEFEPRIEALGERIAAMPTIAATLNKRNVDAALDAMGWNEARGFSQSHYALIDSMAPHAVNAAGERLADVLQERGFKEFLRARDAAFAEPWLRD
jgi:enoyl-CoA hydratase/carnithine racemase